MSDSCSPFEGTGGGCYRCQLCGEVNGPGDRERHGGCLKCGHKKINTTNLSLAEKISQLIKHPVIFAKLFYAYFGMLLKATYFYLKSKVER